MRSTCHLSLAARLSSKSASASSAVQLLNLCYDRYEFQLRIVAYDVVNIGPSGIAGLLAHGTEKTTSTARDRGWKRILSLARWPSPRPDVNSGLISQSLAHAFSGDVR